MPRAPASGTSPDWDRLYESASAQAGYVSLAEAVDAGYSRQLLQYHVKDGRLERVGRGVYRLVHYPASEHEDLVPLWLWSAREGVFSHETALALYQLSDSLPAKRHMTLPAAWARRRLRPPKGVILHFADVPQKARSWLGPVPVTTPLRTIVDCSTAPVSEDFVRQATQQGVRRGLFARDEVRAAVREARREEP